MQKDTSFQIFCDNFRYLRKTNHLSQKEMAQLLHISTNYVRRLENGIIPPRLGVNVFFDIRKHFHIPIPDLLSRTIEKPLHPNT